MGKLHTKDVLENHLKDQPFRLVHCVGITPSLRKRKESLTWIVLGYALYAGGMWKGDIMVADNEELETMDTPEIYSKRLNAEEVIFPKENAKLIFPATDGRRTLFGGDQELRTSTLIRDHPNRGRDFLGESEGSPPPPPHDSFPDAGESTKLFLVHVRKLHIPPSR